MSAGRLVPVVFSNVCPSMPLLFMNRQILRSLGFVCWPIIPDEDVRATKIAHKYNIDGADFPLRSTTYIRVKRFCRLAGQMEHYRSNERVEEIRVIGTKR